MVQHISELGKHDVDIHIQNNTHFVKMAGKLVFASVVHYTIFVLCIYSGVK